jgi:hypothetical protein
LKNRAGPFFPLSLAPALALFAEAAWGEQEQEQDKE